MSTKIWEGLCQKTRIDEGRQRAHLPHNSSTRTGHNQISHFFIAASISNTMLYSILVILVASLFSSASAQGSQIKPSQVGYWNVEFFGGPKCGALNDGVGKAELCYQRYEEEIKTADENYCCPNWQLADCLINGVAPGCDQETRDQLMKYWVDYFENTKDCTSYKENLDGSEPFTCSWLYHKGAWFGWFFGTLGAIWVACCVCVGIKKWCQKKKKARSPVPASPTVVASAGEAEMTVRTEN